MGNEPQKLLNGGPVFEPGPGWGFYVKRWIKKYIFGGDCTLCRTTRYILLFGAILLIFFGTSIRSYIIPNKNGQRSLENQNRDTITEIIRPGDSKTLLVRRAIADFLAESSDPSLTNGQKVFAETVLSQKVTADLKPGASIEFSAEDLAEAIEKSKSLSPSQLLKWEGYAKGIRF